VRRIAVVACAVIAVGVAAGLGALAVGAGAGSTGAVPSASASDIAHAVSANDYCFVEAMIYYRVSEEALAGLLESSPGISDAARGVAARAATRAEEELTHLREWYLDWAFARPADPPVEGPCAGHGAEHAQMPGVPSWTEREGLAQAEGAVAEQAYDDLLAAQHAAMLLLIDQVLADDPHPLVREAAASVRAEES
jgi:hypothetical protein